MAKSLLKWQVTPAPTGRYRSFNKRGWPSAFYNGVDKIAVAIYCPDDYTASAARTGRHAELTIRIADHREQAFEWRTLKARAKTLDEAKAIATTFLTKYPHYQPTTKVEG